ncbi:MAG: chemotaxis protein CheB, partial [Bacteroidia bacterium]
MSRTEIKAIHTPKTHLKSDHFIVGIGASAGGLEVLELFFRQLPFSDKFTFVVITHLPKDHKSQLKDILARDTNLPIHEISAGLKLEPNNVYIAPPHSYVGIEKGDFTLEAIPKDEQIPYPINYCFSALAEEYEAQSI